ncbi:uncharacterized protein HMPREF1541_01915 [Cyphellophora europaea CBS 101466]|uniref:UBC core domain-containing protein n=1 Tax=Cyphellophora europaea (strain CBS 101466) TaxID=1220924 RepID=W2S253_CYPE1|nr:uncharacterized protein HMPREF1541_01915 [Cyphellophora europaea CBS 101466]ETN42757.1 hypothetical protein HMPREF1541_01915 [Cyphellophora europaea CBS 101466]
MATKAAHKRLTREYAAIQANPPPYIVAHPTEANILEWHYLLTGAPDTPYAGGQYWGTLIFPPDYPFAPPAIRMHTPSGRFQPSTRLCLSISDFHPKSFNPAWSVSTILIGLLSFMNSEEMTAGSLSATRHERRWHAARSRWWNSTGGGSATEPPRKGNNVSTKTGPRSANIKAGDGGKRFREEWPEEDEANWSWMEEVGVEPATGKVPPAREGEEEKECGPDVARWRQILGGGGSAGGSLGQRAKDAGDNWVGRWKWWLLGAVVTYLVISRVLFAED